MKKIRELNIDEFLDTANNGWLTIVNRDNSYISSMKCFKNCEDITVLEAKKINLLKTHKSIFINFENLYVLDLRENKLSKLSKSISSLKQLKVLRLDFNQITFLPNSIGLIENLEILTISNNELRGLPISIQNLLKLKTLKLSNNKISKIPIEIGHLKYLECLHLDSNYFSEIPTTLYYLKHLNEFCFEWLEYLEPPFQKTNKDNIGKTIIQLIKNSLQELLKQNILFCDFHTFIERNSNKATFRGDSNGNDKSFVKSDNTENINQSKDNKVNENDIPIKKVSKLFLAVENNYYGVIKAYIEKSSDYLNVKNKDNKNLLSFAMNFYKLDIIDLIIAKTDFSMIQNSHVYLHKAIRMRDPLLVMKLLRSGISINAIDDQGNNCFHILFSAFNKNFSKCTLIGDILLQKECRLNVLNNDLMTPVHIAIKKSTKECIKWIINQNKVLKDMDREVFDLNTKGKNNITPLHLAANLGKLEEILILLDSGVDILAKTLDNKTARKSQTGNYFISKILRNFETNLFFKKYFHDDDKVLNLISNNKSNNCFTTVEELSNYDDVSSKLHINRNNKIEDRKDNLLFATISEDRNFTTNKLSCTNIFNNTTNKKFVTSSSIKSEVEISITNNFKTSGTIANPDKIDNDNIVPSESTPYFSFSKHNYNSREKLVSPKVSNLADFINNNNSNDLRTETPKFKKNGSTRMTKAISHITNKYNTLTSQGSNVNNLNPVKGNKVNYHFYKEILLNNESSLCEKQEALMYLRISNDKIEIEKIIKLLIENLDYSNCENNCFIFCDLCHIILTNRIFPLIIFIEKMQKKILEGELPLNKKSKTTMLLEIKNCLTIICADYEIEISRKKQETEESTNNIILVKNAKSAASKHSGNNEDHIKETSQFQMEDKQKIIQNLNQNSKIKNMSKYFNQNKINDEFNYEEMNEVSNSNIDLKSYTNHVPKKLLMNLGSRPNSTILDNESCNIIDTSRSCLKNEDSKLIVIDKVENSLFKANNQKPGDASFLDFDNN